ncbi:TRAP transporter large permease subunit [Methyloversatilis sp. XJ19-13]|uniref:TRAP transporter large permease n=1 Tax=Methyloversatilis sp. XJ19-13 TaxID=2963430 RepID=UPI00211C4E23|nr:TRAP transporter large permease subunit [Methyloversatilis sp. XJ19-13]MCQ9376225.1 TRAP transporter large permease subunit [Methyloversatilis sp. XJ19-13]
MSAWLAANLAPVMFAAMVLFLLSGVPVAFALAACGIVFGLIGIELGLLSASLVQAMPDRVWGVMSNDTLLAIPFFTFMGLVLERSGMAEDLLDTVGRLFGTLRGGLAVAVVLVGALLAATTGVVAASVISMGLISLPIMLRAGYDARLASGVICASGTLAQIIPPSLVLIVLADQLGRPVGDMYRGALLPGLVLTGLYLIYVLAVAWLRPHKAPALPEADDHNAAERRGMWALFAVAVLAGVATSQLPALQAHTADARALFAVTAGGSVAWLIAVADRLLSLNLLPDLARRVAFVLMPPLALIFLVLGTIYLGLATPTEGGAMGATGALLMAAARQRLNRDLLQQALDRTVRLTTFVLFILIGSRVFSLTFYGIDGHLWVEHLLLGLPGGETGFLIVVMTLVFVLAFFLDFFELAFIVVPLLAPVADKLGIDLVWFGVLLAVNMQTSFMHPPFGFALFYLRSVAPKTLPTRDIYWGAVPFVGIQIVMVALVLAVPQLVTANLGSVQRAAGDSVTTDADYWRSSSAPRLPAGHPDAALEAAIEKAEAMVEPIVGEDADD